MMSLAVSSRWGSFMVAPPLFPSFVSCFFLLFPLSSSFFLLSPRLPRWRMGPEKRWARSPIPNNCPETIVFLAPSAKRRVNDRIHPTWMRGRRFRSLTPAASLPSVRHTSCRRTRPQSWHRVTLSVGPSGHFAPIPTPLRCPRTTTPVGLFNDRTGAASGSLGMRWECVRERSHSLERSSFAL
jgi:hypothetical protein